MNSRSANAGHPLGLADWRRALPWLLLFEIIYLAPYCFRPGGVAAKYIWDEHCVDHTYPVAWLAREEVRDGFFPLWNQYSGAGLPLLANTLDETIVPHAIVKYLLPFPLGLNVFIALKIFIALTGCFALCRSLRASRQGAILGAVIYTFTGFIALNVNSVIGSTFVMPWCIFGLHRLAVKPTLRSALITTLAFAVCLLGGNPQTPFIALLLGMGLYLTTLIVRRTPFSLARFIILPGAAVALAAPLAAPQLLPFVEYLSRAFSHHLPGYGLLHLDPRGVIGVMSPLWDPAIVLMSGKDLGASLDAFLSMRFPPPSYAEATIPLVFEHLGIAAVMFAVIALARLRRLPGEAAFFAAVAVFGVGQAFGLFPFSLLSRVPPFDQISNWRFTTFPAALASAALASLVVTDLGRSASKKEIELPLAVTMGLALVGMVLVMTQAGLPLTSLLIVGPVIAVIAITLILAISIRARRPALIIAVAFLELLLYDRVTDRPLFPHPHRVLRDHAGVDACAPVDPDFRFAAYGDVLDPSLGMLLGPRYDLRSYEMIFPENQVRWFEAVNRWKGREDVIYYLTHYYFMIEPGRLAGPDAGRASLKWVMAENFLPESDFARAYESSRQLAPAADYIKPISAGIGGVVRKGIFQHARSRLTMTLPASPALAGYAALAPWAWGAGRGDGVQMQISIAGNQGPPRLIYARYLDPRHRPDERAWLPVTLPESNGESNMKLSVLPGPRDDARSDYGLWADFHDPAARTAFESQWKRKSSGAVKCYENTSARPRLRVARAVERAADLDECLAGTRDDQWPADGEVIVDKSANAASGTGRVESVQWGANRIEAKVIMDAAGTLVLADTYYPGWTAAVDNAPVRILRADCTFRAVPVPAGKHEIAFCFLPVSFRIGLWCGIVSWITLAGLGWKNRGRTIGNSRTAD